MVGGLLATLDRECHGNTRSAYLQGDAQQAYAGRCPACSPCQKFPMLNADSGRAMPSWLMHGQFFAAVAACVHLASKMLASPRHPSRSRDRKKSCIYGQGDATPGSPGPVPNRCSFSPHTTLSYLVRKPFCRGALAADWI